jgi:DNA-binding NarL/FixJ family response regulator
VAPARDLLIRRTKAEIVSLGTHVKDRPPPKTMQGHFDLLIDRGVLDKPLQGYLRTLKRDFPQAKRLVLDAHLSDNDLCSLLNQGAYGFVPYAQVRQSLPRAIQAVVNGHVWIPSRVLERYVSYLQQLSQAKRRSREELSRREAEIFQLLQQKLSNKEISSALAISESTVKFHLVRIFQKLGIHSRCALLETGKEQR